MAPYGHGGGSQGIAAGPRVHPDPPPHPTGPGRPAPVQAPQAQGEHSLAECRIPAPRLPAKPWPACDPAVAAAAEEGAERGAKGALGGPLGGLGYTYHRHISINWCATHSLCCMRAMVRTRADAKPVLHGCCGPTQVDIKQDCCRNAGKRVQVHCGEGAESLAG